MRRRRILAPGDALLGTLLRSNVRQPPRTAHRQHRQFQFYAGSRSRSRSGTKITWNNRDDIPHTVTDASNPRAFKSAALDTGDSFSQVFPAPGTYHYFCSLHPHMQGTVVVR